MAGAKNKVIAGDYKGAKVASGSGGAGLSGLVVGLLPMKLTRKNVTAVTILDGEQNKSASSAATRGVVGGLLAGTAGMLAGAVSGKTKSIYHVEIDFADGKRSLLEVDFKTLTAIQKSCF